ncbi:MAG: hypothetical protein PHF31_05075 [Methylobacter sp.]|nr:hypothetical protein [Methylobacter sp.]
MQLKINSHNKPQHLPKFLTQNSAIILKKHPQCLPVFLTQKTGTIPSPSRIVLIFAGQNGTNNFVVIIYQVTKIVNLAACQAKNVQNLLFKINSEPSFDANPHSPLDVLENSLCLGGVLNQIDLNGHMKWGTLLSI